MKYINSIKRDYYQTEILKCLVTKKIKYKNQRERGVFDVETLELDVLDKTARYLFGCLLF